jgi:SAM-dependent methyltransferase
MSSSYDHIPDFGLLYDSVPAYSQRADVPFYVGEAARVEGSVLELGCGTGRILLPLARAGRAVVGVDSSEAMLARCLVKVRAEPESVRTRVVLHRGDVRTFDLGRTYELVIAPFRILQHLTTIEDQLQFLENVARHLAPGGRFVFDVFNPSFSAMTAFDGTEREDTPEQPISDGRSFRRTVRIARVRWVEQVSETELIYYLSDTPGAPARRYVQSFDMRWYLRAELLHLLARGGFHVQAIYGDFDRAPFTDRSPELVVCAQRL